MSPEDKWRLEHLKMHEKHRGHESMHAEMVLILFATLIVSQIALVKWRQIYPNSYHVRKGEEGEGRKDCPTNIGTTRASPMATPQW